MPSFATYIQINKSLSSPNNQNNQNNGASAGANTARKDTTLDRVDAKVDLVYRFLSTKFNELSGQDTTQSLSTNTHIDAVKSDILGEIQQLKTLLTGMKTGEEQSSADIEAKMQNIANVVDDIFSGQSDIKKEVGDSADELAQSISGLGFSMDTKLSDIKDSIMVNGRKIIELKDEVKPILLDLSNKYSSFVQTGGMDKSEARKLDTLPIYARVSKAKYPFGERTVYDNFVAANDAIHNVIPYDCFEALQDELDNMYNTYTCFYEYLADLKDEETSFLKDFEDSAASILANSVYVGKGVLYANGFFEKAAALTATTVGIGHAGVLLTLATMVGGVKLGHDTLQKRRSLYKRYESLCKLGNDSTDILNQFYCDKDREIVRYLCELKVYGKEKKGHFLAGISSMCDNAVELWTEKKHSNSEFKYAKMYYMDIFEIFYKLRDNVSLPLNDEVIKRIALAYIMADKLLEKKIILPNSTNISLNPWYTPNSPELQKGSTVFTDTDRRKYLSFYRSVHAMLMQSILVVEGFSQELVYNIVVKAHKDVQKEKDITILTVDSPDIDSLSFNFDDYKTRL